MSGRIFSPTTDALDRGIGDDDEQALLDTYHRELSKTQRLLFCGVVSGLALTVTCVLYWIETISEKPSFFILYSVLYPLRAILTTVFVCSMVLWVYAVFSLVHRRKHA